MITTIPFPIIQPPHHYTIPARPNHSLMGGLTGRYCYSLWGLAVHTNRRLCWWCCQQRWSSYLHTYNSLEWNPTGRDLVPTRQLRVSQHQGQCEIMNPESPLTCTQLSPRRAERPKTCSTLVRWKPSLSMCGFKCWGPPNHFFSISGKPTPCFCIIPLNPPTPPISLSQSESVWNIQQPQKLHLKTCLMTKV